MKLQQLRSVEYYIILKDWQPLSTANWRHVQLTVGQREGWRRSVSNSHLQLVWVALALSFFTHYKAGSSGIQGFVTIKQ